MDTSHRYAYARQGERSGKSLTRSRQGESGPSDFALLLIAVAAAGASQTGVLAFLPDLVREGLGESTVDSQGFHTAGLAAAHPVGALLLAPLWGWLADRYDYRILLRTTLVILALATTATGAHHWHGCMCCARWLAPAPLPLPSSLWRYLQPVSVPAIGALKREDSPG
ncbi:MAG: hypothetical protein KF823_08990 [Xanthomonadales bacterium]|nr:hypothetical protein [Xanthomonadales bacterium]